MWYLITMFNFDVNGGLTNNWQDNPIKFPTGLITRSRAKKIQGEECCIDPKCFSKESFIEWWWRGMDYKYSRDGVERTWRTRRAEDLLNKNALLLLVLMMRCEVFANKNPLSSPWQRIVNLMILYLNIYLIKLELRDIKKNIMKNKN